MQKSKQAGAGTWQRPADARRMTSWIICAETLLIIGVGVMGGFGKVKHALVLATTHQPERLTELYFPPRQPLPHTYTPGGMITVRFVIHNLEYKSMTYPYQITLADNKTSKRVAAGSVHLSDTQDAVITKRIPMPSTSERLAVSVRLPNVHESIHFWMQGA